MMGDALGDLPGILAVSLSVCRMAYAVEPHLLLPVILVHFEGLSTVRCASLLPIAP